MLAAALDRLRVHLPRHAGPPEQAPWLVTLTTRGPFCGGALIAPDRVLTAAHCVQGADPDRVRVRIGGVRHAWRGARFPTTYREIPSPVDPDNPSASGTVDDIAVIELSQPVTGVAAAAARAAGGRARASRRRRSAPGARDPTAAAAAPRARRRRRSAATAPPRTARALFHPDQAPLHARLHAERQPGLRGRQRQPGDGPARRRLGGRGRRHLGRRDLRARLRRGPAGRLRARRRPRRAAQRRPARSRRTPSGASACAARASTRRCVVGAWHPSTARLQGSAGTARPSRVVRATRSTSARRSSSPTPAGRTRAPRAASGCAVTATHRGRLGHRALLQPALTGRTRGGGDVI